MAQATCLECAAEFDARRKDSRFCSRSCAGKSQRRSNVRRCEVDGCDQPHGARGMCYSHYGSWHREQSGRARRNEYFDITCIVCGSEHRAARRDGKFCSDTCKGAHYSATRRTRSALPAEHPVMLLIAEAKAARARDLSRRKMTLATTDRRTARECPTCSCWFTPLHKSAGHMTYCSDRCGKRAARLRRRAREHNTANEWSWSDFMRMARRFNYCCAYCGVKPERLDPDHVVPLSRGGADALSNLLPTCMLCNSDKSARTLDEWAAWRQERGKPPVATFWTPGDPRYVHLAEALLSAA